MIMRMYLLTAILMLFASSVFAQSSPAQQGTPSTTDLLRQAQAVVDDPSTQSAYRAWDAKGIPVSMIAPGIDRGRVVIDLGVATPVTDDIRRELPKEIGGFPVTIVDVPREK